MKLIVYAQIPTRELSWRNITRVFMRLQPYANWTQDEMITAMKAFVKSNKLDGTETRLTEWSKSVLLGSPLVIGVLDSPRSQKAVWSGTKADAVATFKDLNRTPTIDEDTDPDFS